MTDSMVTYQSRNAKPEHAWLGYIWTEAGRLHVSFFAATEEEVKEKMREFWAKDKEVRDANRARREEAKAAAEVKAAKKKAAA